MDNMSIKTILTLLQSEYPHSFSTMDSRTMKAKIELWEQEFAEDNINLVYAAVRLYMKYPNQFAPNIGQIRENMRTLQKKESAELPDQAAWAKVSKACANGLYGYREEFNALPEDIQRAVGAPEQLKAWAQMDADTVESVVASNFMRNYRALKKREKDMEMLPAEMRERLTGISSAMAIESPRQTQAPLLPPRLEPMIKKAIRQPAEAPPPASHYRQKAADDWESRRQAAIDQLMKGASQCITSD